MAPSRPCRGLVAAAVVGAVVYLRPNAFALPSPSTLRGTSTAVSASEPLAAGRIGAEPLRSLVPRKQQMDSLEQPLIMPDFDLTGKVCLITGASRGIGASIAGKLAAAGATIVGTGISDEEADEVSKRFPTGKGYNMNVVNAEQIDETLKAIEEEFGGVDILINNAGITQDTLMMRMKESQWDAVINVNLNSVFKMSKAVIKGMTKKKWGRIISISSVVGSMGNVGQTNYAASKAGIDGFSRALAREVGSRGITVNSVAPGFIDTKMTQGLPDDIKAKLLEQVPVGRLGQADEIADAVLFLAAPTSKYITGQTLHVNGGMYMK